MDESALRTHIERAIAQQHASDTVLRALLRFIARDPADSRELRRLLSSEAEQAQTLLLGRPDSPEALTPRHQAYAEAMREYWEALE